MKKLLLILFIFSYSFIAKGTIHQIQVWNGYYQFLPSNNITVQLGDTIQWIPLDPPTMTHTITSDVIPSGAAAFNQIWQLPADTFFQYIPQIVGLYKYVCTPHINFNMIGEFTVVNGTNLQQTYVPDNYFEQYLENNGMGNGIPNDEYVTTTNINTVTYLDVSHQFISDLTGIEDFTALTYFNCDSNQLISLDVSQNTALTTLDCQGTSITSLDVSQNTSLARLWCNVNQLTSLDVSNNTDLTDLRCGSNLLTILDVRNGNNTNIIYFTLVNNPNLTCINVDDSSWSSNWWTVVNGNIDSQHYFSANCSPSAIQEETTNKELLKIIDILGRETKGETNKPLFYIYDDGSVEKRITIENYFKR